MTAPLLRATDLIVDIAGSRVLCKVSATFAPGAVTAIVGPNGAGKSTLLETLGGARRFTSGIVEREGVVALVVQRVAAPETLPLTVHDVVAMGAWGRAGRAHRSRWGLGSANRATEDVGQALERVALSELATRPFTSLSGGQRQRVLLAQGLARRADIFLLDEPATGLDADSRERVHRVLDEEAERGALIACVTHDADAIARAHHTVAIEAGEVVVP